MEESEIASEENIEMKFFLSKRFNPYGIENRKPNIEN